MDSGTLGLKLFMLLFLISCSADSDINFNQLKTSEENYLNWVRRISWRNHSILMEPKEIFHPCKNIEVHKNPKKGDFTTVKKAIASLPLFNPCRVVISVGPGTYR